MAPAGVPAEVGLHVAGPEVDGVFLFVGEEEVVEAVAVEVHEAEAGRVGDNLTAFNLWLLIPGNAFRQAVGGGLPILRFIRPHDKLAARHPLGEAIPVKVTRHRATPSDPRDEAPVVTRQLPHGGWHELAVSHGPGRRDEARRLRSEEQAEVRSGAEVAKCHADSEQRTQGAVRIEIEIGLLPTSLQRLPEPRDDAGVARQQHVHETVVVSINNRDSAAGTAVAHRDGIGGESFQA